MKKDHTRLFLEIGELSGLFIDSPSLENFLQRIVEMISDHMNSEVCSIYLYYEDKKELVLAATKGLHTQSIGQVKMRMGEGLTGLALKELRAICERNAKQNPHFKFFPGIGEENYASFLAVPIVRGQTKIGVMVIQNLEKNYFNDEDIRVLRAITSQLANTIETIKLLLEFHQKKQSLQKDEPPLAAGLKFIKGKVGAPGFAFSEAIVVKEDLMKRMLFIGRDEIKYSLNDFYKAIELSERELEGLQKQIEEQLFDVASLIFSAQILMLKDKTFIDDMVNLIEAGLNPSLAIVAVVNQYVAKFKEITNPYLREKSHDVRDIGNRLLKNLLQKRDAANEYEGKIVIAEELFPSDALKLASQKVAGIILLSGGASSHLSILARSLNLPLVIVDDPSILSVPPNSKILLDAEQGSIYINPAKDIIDTIKSKEETAKMIHVLKDSMTDETRTVDGVKITLLANINLLGDLKAANAFKAEGVGLYRSEFPFIIRSDFPSEEEQYVIYKKLMDVMKGKEVTLRTLDIGGDKVLSYYHHGKEENPFLGMRSIRFSLKHKDVFCNQLRAMLRAGYRSDLRIMFPMISSLDEFLEAQEVVHFCIAQLKEEKINFHERPQIGLMIELPSVLEIIDDLAQAADFFSIGTNDFIQYMLAVDRTNEKVAEFYLPHHPSVLRAFKKVADAANRHKKDVSICGDMAHDEKYIPYFLGLGIRKISVDPSYLPKVQKLISGLKITQAQKDIALILSKNRIRDIEKLVYGPKRSSGTSGPISDAH